LEGRGGGGYFVDGGEEVNVELLAACDDHLADAAADVRPPHGGVDFNPFVF
jgi:hypothetical protein